MDKSIISDWKPEFKNLFSREQLRLHHRLNDSGLFTKEAIADLIDRCEPHHYNLATMGYDIENPVWREGTIRGVGGKEVINSIEQGRMWLNILNPAEVDQQYQKLLDSIFEEFKTYMPDFNTYKRKLGILISSPLVQVFYHADIPGQALWQLQGEKRVFVYPSGEPYLSQKSLEGIIIGETEEDIPYSAEFEKGVTTYDLKAGEMLHWPLNFPHRVENKDCLNISVTTEHYTDEIRNSYAVNYANGILRRNFGMNNLSQSITGPMVYPKAALTMFWKKFNLNKKNKFQRIVDFTIDPSSSTGISDIPAYVR